MSTTTELRPANVEAPPSVDRTVGALLVDERRVTPRRRPPLSAEVRPLGLVESHRCSIDDISEGGLFVCVPLSFGLNVGQRCEVLLSTLVAADSPLCPTDDPCYATVIRTEVIHQGSKKLLGAGLRFDQPLFL
ncbi:MAG: PilZ domain-containing protein [Phycisphaerales bacterium]|nr:PilZ domain-containing protein [Phycisphaerales bacterium]